MTSPTIALYFLILLPLNVLYASGTRIFGIQQGDDPFKLTILCPEVANYSCLFNLPGLRPSFRTVKVPGVLHEHDGTSTFVLDWDLAALDAYVHAVRYHRIFQEIRSDGFTYIDFYMAQRDAAIDMSLSEEEYRVVPQLDDDVARGLCQQLGCL
ncbi:hypothetical protein FOL47_008824 [Perkinsus chesapeaki]|uniref:Uncharacterized protein n=1 Tax=Perkinsus chesapeaki TaxID=330153 RepID=A0A7J6LBL2_PERCH|nr:hypothetical protein FOL47_008824 [Perkinsus chesapeaki]